MSYKLTGDQCRCAACGEYFNSTKAFDKHRFGDWFMRRCRTPDAMRARGMSKNLNQRWITSKRSASAIAQLRSSRDLIEAVGE